MDVKKLDDQAIFEVARKISSREARQAYLAQICGEDMATAERIKALLLAHDDSASFLETPPSAIVAISSPTIDQHPREARYPDRPLQAPATDWRRGHGYGLHG